MIAELEVFTLDQEHVSAAAEIAPELEARAIGGEQRGAGDRAAAAGVSFADPRLARGTAA